MSLRSDDHVLVSTLRFTLDKNFFQDALNRQNEILKLLTCERVQKVPLENNLTVSGLKSHTLKILSVSVNSMTVDSSHSEIEYTVIAKLDNCSNAPFVTSKPVTAPSSADAKLDDLENSVHCELYTKINASGLPSQIPNGFNPKAYQASIECKGD